MKRTIILIISLLCWAVAAAVRQVRKLTGFPAPGRCVVLYYHEVTAADRQLFARQMDQLVRFAAPVACGVTSPLRPGTLHAGVSFDDGFQSVFENAIPLLAERGIPSTVFVVSGQLGRRPEWQMEPACHHVRECLADADVVKNMSGDLVTIGSHTCSHPHMTRLIEEDIHAELAQSRTDLERLLGRPVTLMAFPYGEFDDRTLRHARAAGYKRVFMIKPGTTQFAAGEFLIPRVAVQPQDWPLEFRLKLFGAYSWVRLAARLKRKLRRNRP